MKILIIKFGAIGDAIFTTSMIPLLRDKYKNAQISWLCGKNIEPLINTFSGLDNIYTVDTKLLTGGIIRKILFVLKIWKKFIGKKFDIVLLAHRDKRYEIINLGIRGDIKKLMSSNRDIISGRYHANEYARFADSSDSFIENDYHYTKHKDIENITNLKNTILLLPGGAKNLLRDDPLRRWSIQNYKSLAIELIKLGEDVALFGGKDDIWVLDQFKDINITSYIGKTDLKDAISYIYSCKCIISHDSGPIYIADFLQTPFICIYGPVKPFERLSQNSLKYSLSIDMPCAPCYDGFGYAKDCKNNLCMQNISVNNVISKLKELNLIS